MLGGLDGVNMRIRKETKSKFFPSHPKSMGPQWNDLVCFDEPLFLMCHLQFIASLKKIGQYYWKVLNG